MTRTVGSGDDEVRMRATVAAAAGNGCRPAAQHTEPPEHQPATGRQTVTGRQPDIRPGWATTADRLLRDALGDLVGELRAFADGLDTMPGTYLDDHDTQWVWTVDVPQGLRRRDLDVTVDGDRIMVTGERRPGRLRRRQRGHQSWQAAARLPVMLDEQDVSATMRDGQLRVVIPKPRAQRRIRIPVRAELHGRGPARRPAASPSHRATPRSPRHPSGAHRHNDHRRPTRRLDVVRHGLARSGGFCRSCAPSLLRARWLV